jgi:ATP-dependent helicase YprA (DUF1998 family)
VSELLPTIQASGVREGLLDYLSTTFALADEDARAALLDFLQDPQTGIFKGPYLRLRLPFRPADDGWREALDWYEGFPPYGHQAAAFKRLSSANLGSDKPRPLPTLVTTGTGSGKTEAFLYPIVDHVLRAKRQGVTGMKALILYPMNALANDQAQRLADLISGHEELSGVTAALYTGQGGPQRTKVSSEGLITDRAVIRSDAPDILLTNYKMLDQLLLRHADARIWEQSAHSLQLDEFHTYDGAQGTDVSMLLRRLGLALKSHWSRDGDSLTDEDWDRPLGRITPVATSATLGDKGDPAAMLGFARTVFGEEFGDDAVVTESRLSHDDWTAESRAAVQGANWTMRDDATAARAVAAAFRETDHEIDGETLSDRVAAELFTPPDGAGEAPALVDLFRAHPLTGRLVEAAGDAVALSDMVDLAVSEGQLEEEDALTYLLAFTAALSHLRAVHGRQMVSVELHLWIRELTRIDRAASLDARYHWFDDGELIRQDDEGAYAVDVPMFPALHCRHCGRSGWGVVLAPTGADLDTSDEDIRRKAFAKDERFRALILAVPEGEVAAADAKAAADGLRWFHVTERHFLNAPPADEAALREGRVLPVLMHVGQEAGKLSKDDVCPSCQSKDGIRFLGSAIATQLSVALSTLFGNSTLDQAEKKALVFTDSVQDAAHRAGFVQSRSHSLTLRSVLRQAIGQEPVSLDLLADRVIELAGDDPHRRYRILPPDLADRDEFAPFWQARTLAKVTPTVRARVRRRLLLDAALEFGLQSRVGRTLELTGSVAAHVDVPERTLLAAARQAIEEAGGTGTLQSFAPTDRDLVVWVRGVLERMRERGSIEHEWFRKYIENDGARYFVWGGRPRSQGMPAFPSGRAAPGYPRVGGGQLTRDVDLDPVATPRSWYALWAARVLGTAPREGGVLARLLLQRLAKLDVLRAAPSSSGAQIYQIPQQAVVLSAVGEDALDGGDHLLVCDTCQAHTPVSPLVVAQLDGAPCTVARCTGRLVRAPLRDNFYRRMYGARDIQRVIAREHTSLLDDETRLAYEDGFKGREDNPQAPNVLVATPTLEMGIDIGDLSTVMLASLPRSVASYLQRVGRAGRLTGNALNLAFVTGRGEQLPQLGEPLSMINGKVRPPATYLDAEEILRRQYVASVADRLARREDAPHPASATQAIGSVALGSYLHSIIVDAETDPDGHLERFLDGFPHVAKETKESLRDWVARQGSSELSSRLSMRLHDASHRWTHEVETLNHRISAIEETLPELQQRAESPAATDDDKTAYRTAVASLRLTRGQRANLRGDYWIGVLEEYGLFPNYTLLDDSVTLDVSLSWVDAETGDYRSEPHSYERGAALALRDFAPGATFYAGGNQIRIDAVELGRDGDAVRRWAFCPACGYGKDITDTGVSSCPRCGAIGIGDVRQRLDVVELEKVSAAMRRDEATIDDSRDERLRERFDIVTAADIDEAKLKRQWYVDGYGFGIKYLKDMTIRWLNLGRAIGHGSSRSIAGEDRSALLFRVCSSCGQLDISTQRNRATEHRPWCPVRNAVDEQTRSVVLSRTLRTEGLVLRVPLAISLGDVFAMPSLAAAVLLGLREHMGGSPDHIAVETITDPTPTDGSDNRPALLLHDVVPGGTGYLAELADPEMLREILYRAYEVVRDCPCRDEGRASCHRCLLPFAGPSGTGLVSRVAAERHLRDILLGGAGSDEEPDRRGAWSFTEDPMAGFDPESHIEQKFRQVLRERLQALGATVDEKPGAHGNRFVITLGGGRVWTLDPQEYVLDSRPDFMLRSNDSTVPPMAIFCDGWKFHANPALNRLADDAAKRQNLRDGDHVVLALSWQDLEPDGVPAPGWLNEDLVGPVTSMAQAALTPGVVDLLRRGPMDLLLQWIQSPDPAALAALADWLPMLMLGRTQHNGISDGSTVAEVAAALLTGDELVGTPPSAWAWQQDTMVLLARKAGDVPNAIEVGLVLDDSDDKLGPDHVEAWRGWLRLSNFLNLRTRPTTVTVTSVVGAAAPSGVSEEIEGGVPEGLREAYELAASEMERRLMLDLHAAGVEPATYGYETEEGIPLSVSWPDRRIVVDLDLPEADAADLRETGWTIVKADPESIGAALAKEGA